MTLGFIGLQRFLLDERFSPVYRFFSLPIPLAKQHWIYPSSDSSKAVSGALAMRSCSENSVLVMPVALAGRKILGRGGMHIEERLGGVQMLDQRLLYATLMQLKNKKYLI